MMQQDSRRHTRPSWLSPGQRRLLVAAAATVGVVAAYKVYRSERLKQTQQALQTAADTFARYSNAASSVGQVAAVITADIQAFLASDSDEVPRSLRQLAKLARCSDVQDTLAACIASSIKGMLNSSSDDPSQPSLVDKVIEAVLSDRGQTLVGLAVRTAAHQSTETFCTALRQGLEAALQAAGVGQQQQQPQQYMSPPSQGTTGGFYSALSSPAGSPQPQQQQHRQPQQQHVPYNVHTFTAFAGSSSGAAGMPPAVRSLLAVLSSPQLLQAVDGLVSTCVGSTVGAYMAQAGPSDSMLSSVLHTLSQPANKALVIDIMSQVSATFCREMAAACVAPASAVATSRPSSRLSDVPALSLEQQEQHQQLLLQRQPLGSPMQVVSAASPAGAAGSSSASPCTFGPRRQQDPAAATAAAAVALHHSISEAAFSHTSEAAGAGSCLGSEPSSPQSGPSTPEPSVAAAESAGGSAQQQQQQQQPRHASYGSFASSAVAGLIMRRRSFPGLLSGAGAAAGTGAGGIGVGAPAMYAAAAGSNGGVLVDPAALGPMSTAVSLFVQAARFQEFRSLMVDVSRSSTREFVQSLLPVGWLQAVGGSRRGGGSSSSSMQASAAVTVALQKVYTAMSVLILLVLYALSPKTLMLEGSS